MKPARHQTAAELAFNIQDVRETIAIWDRPQCAGQNPKLPQYTDELHQCLAERFRREHAHTVVVEIPATLARRLGLV